jgi:BirA family transcriptional regulator, biotin operon repressor / biotin---[acetyl-CoA-carboxylase] ligase
MAQLSAHEFGLPGVVFDEIDSTNAEAMRRAVAGERGPLWIAARRQTRGRGRSGRYWSSEPGNLYASLLITLECQAGVAQQLSLVAGVAVIDAIRAAAGGLGKPEGLRLKWPNDVLIGRAKCAGILPESLTGSIRPGLTAIIGVGVNLAHLPTAISGIATRLVDHGVDVTPDEMLRQLAVAMGHWLGIWRCGPGFSTVRTAWLACATAPGKAIAVNTGAGRIQGRFGGIDDSGALLLLVPGEGVQRFDYGDVELAHDSPDNQRR